MTALYYEQIGGGKRVQFLVAGMACVCNYSTMHASIALATLQTSKFMALQAG